MDHVTTKQVTRFFVHEGRLKDTTAMGPHVPKDSVDKVGTELWFCGLGIRKLSLLEHPVAAVIPRYIVHSGNQAYASWLKCFGTHILEVQDWVGLRDENAPHWMQEELAHPNVGSGAKNWIGKRQGVKFVVLSSTSHLRHAKYHTRHAVCVAIDFR